MKLRASFAVAATLAVCTSLLAQEPRRDGNWEITMKMEMPGMPMAMPPITTTKCVTQAEVDDPMKAMPSGQGNDTSKCKMTDYKTEGHKSTWAMKCEGKPAMSGTGEITYAGNTYTGAMKLDSEGHAMSTGRWAEGLYLAFENP